MQNEYPYFVTKEAIEKLTLLLGLKQYPLQDWEHLVVDPKRVTEFLNVYKENLTRTKEEKFTLMSVIIGSIDEGLVEGKTFSQEVWSMLEQMLSSDLEIHKYLIDYWSAWDNEDLSDTFAISGFMRDLAKKYKV